MTTSTPWSFLTGDTEKDGRNVEILLESVEELYGPRAVDELMRSAVDRAIRVTGAERGLLILAGDDGTLQTRVARDQHGVDLPLDTRYSGTVVHKVWDTGQSYLTIGTADEHSHDLSASMVATNSASASSTTTSSLGTGSTHANSSGAPL